MAASPEPVDLEQRMLALEQRVAGTEAMARGADERSVGAQKAVQTIGDEFTRWRAHHVALHQREAEEHAALHQRERAELEAEIVDSRKKCMAAVEESYETLGGVARDLGGKAQTIAEQGTRIAAQGDRIESESRKISAQAWVHSRMGLLVILGASIGGGLFQSLLHWITSR
jgi:hypothetical protein